MRKLILLLFVCVFFNSAKALTYYFSSISGDDSRTPAEAQSQSTPWKTLNKLNSFFPSLQPGDIVLFKKGEVFDGSINVSISGSLSSPITLSSYGTGNKPVINGFIALSNWVSVGNGIYESYNPSLGSSLNMVVVNGIQQAMGRYPNSNAANKGYLIFESHDANNTFITDDQLTSATNWTGAQLVVRTNRFVLDRVLITNHSGGTLTYTPALTYAPANNFGYFIQNDIRTLDQLGEWYYDPSAKKVSMYFGGASPASYTIKAADVDTLFNMYNLDNVIVNGLSFEGANKRGMNFYSVDVGVTKVLNCDIKFCGESALVCGTSKGITIDGNTITDANNFGINCSVGGAGNFIVTNNTIKRISVPLGMSAGGANLNMGIKVNADNSIIEGNILDSIGYSGIRFTGNLASIRKNFIQHYCLNLDDGGGIYANASGASTGRKIISNIVINGGAPMEGQTSVNGATNGIYLDDNVTGITVDSNTVANNNLNGIYLHNCASITARNNTIYNSTISQFRLVHNSPQDNFRSLAINNNIFVAKTPDQFTLYSQTDASDPDFSVWGAIDNNYHARPLLQTTTIKAIKPSYNQNLTVGDWFTLSTFDQHSYTSPKTFPSNINPDDSIRFEYNATTTPKTINLTKPYIDVKSNSYSGTVVLQPYTSLILFPPPITPTVNITAPANNATFAAPATIDITASAGASGLVSKVDFYNGGVLLGTDNTSPYTYTWNNVPSGNYSLTAKVTDDVAKFSTSSVVNISVNQPPTVSITTPSNNASFSAPASVTINATAADADGTVSKVDFYNGTTLLGTDNSSPYSFTWSNVAAGNYFITAKATDNGSLVTTSAVIVVSVNAAPTVSITNPTNNQVFANPANITIDATADDADGTISKVEFYNGATLLGTDNASPYSFTWTNVARGNYSLTAKATDNGSLSATSAPVSVTVNSAPTVSITSPADNQTFAAPVDVTINAAANDVDGTISKVDFYNGTTLLGTDNVSPYSYTWPDVPAGSYTITAKATDNSLLSGTSSTTVISVYTPNVAPTVSITDPVNNQIFPALSNITINASAADVDGTVSKVDFYNGATLLATVNFSPFSFTWTNVSAGSYSITARATDNNNEQGAASAAIAIFVNAAPTASITSPANNQTFPALSDITINATADDVDGTVSKVDFYNGGTLLGTDNTSPFSFTWTNVPAGSYSVTAKATDNNNAQGIASAAVAILVNAAPTVSITSPANNATFDEPASITINATASDEDGTISKVEFYNGNTLLGTDNFSPYSYSWTNVTAGNYSITAIAYDDASQPTSSQAVVVLVNAQNVAPTVNITAPVNNAIFPALSSITINAAANDVDGTISKVDFYNGAALLGTANTSPFSFTWTNVPAGSYSITARATDNNNAQGAASAAIAILVNAAPTASITSPANNQTFAALSNITINATADDVDGTVSKVDFYNGGTLLGTDNVSPFSFTWTNVPAGSYSVTAKATDNNNAQGIASAAVAILVNAAPTVNITSPANNTAFDEPASITINATASDVDGTISKVEFYNGNTLLGTDNFSPYSYSWTNVTAGNYSITAIAYDDASQPTSSQAVIVLVNAQNVAPTINITTPVNNATFSAPASITIDATAADVDGTVTKVEFYNGSTLLGTDNASPFSFTWTTVPAGNYSITAKATDNGLLATTSAAVAVSVTSAPSVSITGPVNNATFSAPASITIDATAADVDGTVTKVEFYNGSTLLGTDNTSPFSFSWTNVAAGNYSITAKATDNGLLATTSTAVAVSVTSAPSVSITGPANNATFSAPASIAIDATAADVDGTVTKVEFYNGSTLLGTDNASPFSFTWTTVPAGNYSITAKATDNGLLATTSAAVAVSVTSAPSVSITGPANNATFSAPASITIDATAADVDGTVTKVEFYNGATLLGTDNTSPFSFTWTSVPAGNYSITAKATDNGLLATTSTAVAVSVTSAPSVSITGPANNATFSAPASITIDATAADVDGTVTKVEFYNGSTLLGTDNTSPFSFSWTNVAAGNYSITAKATDNGLLATTSAAVAVSVTSAPSVSITGPANNATFSAPASITIDATAADVDGTVTKVEFYNGAALLGTDNTSPFSFAWTNVAAGNYSITAKATDNGLLATTSTAVAVSVTSAPTVSITNPANNATFSAPASITIDATAADVDGTVTKVEFYNGATLLGTDNTSPYSFSWTNVAAGNYSITAKATDNGLLATTSTAVAVSVTSAPSVSITGPANNATFSAPASITIDATAADVDGTVTKVEFYNGSTLLGTDNTSPFSFTWTNVAAGNYSITAKATDNGLLATTSAAVAVSVTSAPSVSITGPANNATFSAPASITINASATDVDGTVAKVEFYNGATLLGTDNTSPFSFAWTNVAAGNYSITAKATDNGLLATTSTAVAVSVTSAPSVSITGPVNNATFSAPASITIDATAADVDGTVTKVEFYNGATLLGTDNTSPYSFSWTNVAAGNYSITAKATDNGLLATTSTAVAVSVTSAPTVSITNPANNATFSAPASITIDATAADVDGTVTKVEFYNGATLLGTDNTSPFSFAWTNVAAGNYSITAKATDNGLLATTSTAVAVSVTSAPSVSITGPVNNATFSAPASITIDATAADVDGTVTKVEFYNGATLLGTDNTSPFSFAWTNVAAGNYSITAKATDNGLLTTTSTAVAVSVTSAPSVSITGPVNNATFSAPASITIDATAADVDGTVTKVEFYNGATLLGTDNTSPFSFAWTNVAAGNYSITAKATDNGLLTTTSTAVAISVTSAPSVSITGPANNATFSAPASITINATATDVDGTVTKVEFYNGAALLGTDNTSPFSFAWTNVPAGNYSITAKATDNGLLATTSTAVGVSVTSAPSVSITSPVNNATFSAPASITINATAADADGTISKVDFYNGATLLGTDNTSPYSFTWASVPAGSYSITTKATDNSLLVTTSTAVAVSVTSTPSVSITSPVNNATFSAPASITINATAADADGTISKVDFYNGATLLGTDNTSPYSFTWASVPAGSYSITTKATDNSLLVTTSTAVAVSVTSAPTVSITNPVNNATFSAPASITINATAADADGTISKVDFYNGATLLGTDNTSPYSFTWASVAAGSYSITAKATDNSLLVTTSVAVAVSVTSAPTVSITSPVNNATFSAPASITINATAADADGTISKVDFYNGATLLGTDNTSPYSFTWSSVAAGSYSITAKATDNSLLVTTSAAVAVSVNSAPTVSITSPANNAVFAPPASITINATAADAGGSVTKVDFYNGATLLGTDNTSPYSFTWNSVAAGSYSITAKATDNSSLVTTSTPVAVSVNSAPTVSITSPANNAVFTPPATITINATAADAGGSVTKVDFYNGATLLGTDNTSPYSFTWTSVPAGNYSITAKATDNGSLVTTSALVAISVNSAPTVSITTPVNNASFASPATITIAAAAADAGGSISKVDFYRGSTLLGSDNTSPYTFIWTNVATGNYSLTAKATDNSSLVTTSAAVAISVNSAPTVSITSPANNASFTAPASITIRANAADAGGSISKVDFYNGSTLLGTDNTSPYTFTWNNVTSGNYSLTAKATDNSLLVTTSAAVAIIVTGPPIVSITSPAGNSNFTPPASVVINATASDPGGSVSRVEFFNGSTLLGTDNTSPYSFTWNNVTTGSYSLTARATDNSSLRTTSAAVAITVNAAPTVTITSPANNANFAASSTITINATAADPGGSVSKVEFYNGSTLLGTDNTSPYSFNWTNVPVGNYSVTAKATDNLGLSKVSTTVVIRVAQSLSLLFNSRDALWALTYR